MEGDGYSWGARRCERRALGACVPGIQGVDRDRRGCSGIPGQATELQSLVSRCAFLTTVLIQHGRAVGSLAQVQKPIQDFVVMTNELAGFAARRAKGGKCRAFFSHRPDLSALADFEESLLRGKYEEAEPLYMFSLAIDENVYGPDHPEVAKDLNNCAGLLNIEGKYTEAEPLYERSQAIFETVLGPEQPDLAAVLIGKYAEAESMYERSQAIREKVLGPEHPDVATTLNDRAGLLESQGKYEEAEPLYRRSLAIDETVYGPYHPSVARDLNNWAGLLQNHGKYTEAEPLYE
ncbi:conserved unknown protein [Ectocarpus siliculosus]|uniref:Uncharacterized protein n=1 Tax=Ectocarpus siliculosus TaxID=2880 RepID=D8LDU3_ECTSI|nr:conserved unknown protein [Ectocarpus siliculosus]|eukprot:CBN78500.1 conserved unknown protein [Ectocarpus siliculosus]